MVEVGHDHVRIEINGLVNDYSSIVVACGIQPDCANNELCRNLLQTWPLETVGGFPCVSEDSEWTKDTYVVSSLNIGPDAANLMGMRRAAQVVANAMECRCWLREKNVLRNPC